MFTRAPPAVRVISSHVRAQRVLATGLLLAFVAVCGGTSDAPRSQVQPTATVESAQAIVARIGEQAITSAQLDEPLRLALHDLDMQKYRLRRQTLETAMLREFERTSNTMHSTEMLLEIGRASCRERV